MTREEAFKFLEETSLGGEMIGDKKLVAVCDLAISALREQDERRWIPVTKRFPNTGAVVLTFSKKDGVNIGKYVGYGAFVVRKWDINSKPSRTTHWMPLPKPPKEGGITNGC